MTSKELDKLLGERALDCAYISKLEEQNKQLKQQLDDLRSVFSAYVKSYAK